MLFGNQENQERGTIELSMCIRDKNGKVVGRKNIVADNGNDICEFFERNTTIVRKKRKKKVVAKAAKGSQVKEALDEVETYIMELEAAKQQAESGTNNG